MKHVVAALAVCGLVLTALPVVAPDATNAAAEEAAPQDAPMSREQRIQVQQGLAALGFDPGPADGLFGPRTRAAVWDWQNAKGLEATGFLTREEAEALGAMGQAAGAYNEESDPEVAGPGEPASEESAPEPSDSRNRVLYFPQWQVFASHNGVVLEWRTHSHPERDTMADWRVTNNSTEVLYHLALGTRIYTCTNNADAFKMRSHLGELELSPGASVTASNGGAADYIGADQFPRESCPEIVEASFLNGVGRALEFALGSPTELSKPWMDHSFDAPTSAQESILRTCYFPSYGTCFEVRYSDERDFDKKHCFGDDLVSRPGHSCPKPTGTMVCRNFVDCADEVDCYGTLEVLKYRYPEYVSTEIFLAECREGGGEYVGTK